METRYIAYDTDESGEALSPPPYLVAQEARTNLTHYSNNLTNALTSSGDIDITFDEVGLDGSANSATKLVANTSIADNWIRFWSPSPPVDGQMFTSVFYFKKTETDTGEYPGVSDTLLEPTAYSVIQLNLFTGDTIEAIGSGDMNKTIEVEDAGDWWKLYVQQENLAASTIISRNIYPTSGTVWGVHNPKVAGQAVVVGNNEFYYDLSIADIKGMGPIFTESTTVTTGPLNPTFNELNHSDSEGPYGMKLDWSGDDVDVLTLSDGDADSVEILNDVGFDNACGVYWNCGSGWTISGGIATCDGTNLASINQLNMTDGVSAYVVTVDIASVTSGSLFIGLGATSSGFFSTVGIHTFRITATTNGHIELKSNGFTGSVNSMSVRKLIEGSFLKVEDGDVGNPELIINGEFDDTSGWGAVADWTIADGVVTYTGDITSSIGQILSPLEKGNIYHVEFDVVADSGTGYVYARPGTGLATARSYGVGHYEYDILADAGSYFLLRCTADWQGSVDNVTCTLAGKVLTITDQTNSVSLPMPAAPATVEAGILMEQGVENSVLNFTGTEYGTLSTGIAFSGDFELIIEFSTTNRINQIYLGDDHTVSLYFNLYDVTGNARISMYCANTGGYVDTPIDVWNGEKHVVKYRRVSGVFTIFVDDVNLGSPISTPPLYTGMNNFLVANSNSNSAPFIGNIYSVKFTDSVTPANNQTYIFDSGRTDYQLSDEGSLGEEMVTNGTFDTGIDNWEGVDITYDGGRAKISNANGSNWLTAAYQELPLAINTYYSVTADITEGVTGPHDVFQIRDSVEHIEPSSSATYGSIGLAVKTTSDTPFRINMFSDADTTPDSGYFYVDNVSVKSIDKAVVFTGIDASNWSQGDGLMQLMLDDTYSIETTFDNSFGTGDLTVGENIRDLKRWHETTITTQIPKLNQIQLTVDGEPVYNNGYPVYE